MLDEPAPELHQGCCSFGAELVDDDDVQHVVAAFVRLESGQMQFHHRARDEGFLSPAGERTGTRVIDGACIFLNRPGFERGPGCALHLAALDAGERPIDWKPNVCWQLPLRIERTEPDATTVRLRRWTRRDWGDDHTMPWWCTDSPDALTGDRPAAVTMRDELVEMIGTSRYEQLLDVLGITDDAGGRTSQSS